MESCDIKDFLNSLKNQILNQPRYNLILGSSWLKEVPNKPGVYLIFENNVLCYAGETGSLSGRMKDLFSTVNHSFRRSFGNKHFKDHNDFEPATSKRKFPDDIEILLNESMSSKLKISFLVVELGRKELEEKICLESVSTLYNIRKARYSK